MASQMMNIDETKSLRAIFEELDKDGDAKLTKKEILDGFHKFSGEIEIDIDKIMEECDIDKNGFIDYTEFITAACNWKNFLSQEKLQDVFNIFDIDGNGKISLHELLESFGKEKVYEDFIKELIASVDKNNDGEIDFQEFNDLMRRSMRFSNRA